MSRYAAARRAMVDSQLRPNQVRDEAVLAAMGHVARELFVPNALQGVAYLDAGLPIAPGRWLMEPRVLARLLDAARIGPTDLVLILGCGTGYEAAVVAQLAGTVVAVEADGALRAQAATALGALGSDTVILMAGDPADGHAPQAPYDVILFCGAVTEIPPQVRPQLAPGGRLLAVLRPENGPGRAVVGTESASGLGFTTLFDAATPALDQFAASPGFVF
ncbi:MAG: protein-L-isoaspartate O-methyltransferase [Alphaproteobacteria bacterium]|nr:protein-L-isoaspartate O-methyltransferase [Alphaproteobacteria bacterium]